MATFRFKYEMLLQRRRDLEREHQREVARLQGEHQALTNKLTQMQQTVDQSKRDISQGLAGQVDLRQVGDVVRYSNQVMVQGHEIVQQLATYEQQIEAARQRLSEAVRQRKALEQLRDRHYQQWLLSARRAERHHQDEVATQRFVRQMLGEEPS